MVGIYSQSFKAKFIEEFIDDIRSNTSTYYVTFGKNTPWPDDMAPPDADNSIGSSFYDFYKNLLFGKKLSPSDVAYMARRINWTSGTVYDEYRDTDSDLFNKNFYVVSSSFRVYKCISNNNGAPSTVEPNDLVYNGDFKTADGYRWKFMYFISSANRSKFMSDTYIPVLTNSSVKTAAEPGAIHHIVVTQSGNGYISASGTVDEFVSANTVKVTNSAVLGIPGAYTKSMMYITDATGNFQDSYAIIKDFVVNNSGRYVITDGPVTNFGNTAINSFVIAPTVKVIGDGEDLFAVASVNNVTGSITSIDVINRGINYTFGTVQFEANSNFGFGAAAFPVISPANGHGSDAITELGCDTIGLSLSTNPTDNLPEWATYRQVGLLYNPTASANLQPYKTTTFNQIINFDVSNIFDLFPEGEIITGASSGATATVLYSTTTKLYITDIVGDFQLFETLLGTFTGYTCQIDAINTGDLVPNSGKVFYYRNLEPINRFGVSTEQVKVYFKI